MGKLEIEQEAVARLRGEVEATKDAEGGAGEGDTEDAEREAVRLQELEQRLQEVVEEQQQSVEVESVSSCVMLCL